VRCTCMRCTCRQAYRVQSSEFIIARVRAVHMHAVHMQTVHTAPSVHTTHRVASDVYHGARPVVCPELPQVPEEDVLGHEVPLLDEGLLYAGGKRERVEVHVAVAKLQRCADVAGDRLVSVAVRETGRQDAVG